tara:strand:- start:992 stop:2965 length:1974 start_codon:yes stop_codon:yes gene_type:complete
VAKLLQTNLPFATGPNVTAETFNQLVRTLEINLGSIDPDNTLQLTTAERDELNFNIGQIIYNTTTTTLQYWDGTNFQNISALGAVNLNVSDGSATIGINLGTQTLSLIGGTGITSNASGTSVTFAIDNTVATLTGTQTLTNKTLTSPTLTSPVLNGTLSGSAFLDEDNMASNSATAVASQQSIKAYVDSQVTAQDLDISDGSATIAIDLDTETLSLLGGTGLTSTASGNGVTFAIDSTVATLTGTQTLTNKTLSSPVLNGTLSGTAFKDEDNMSSNSATAVASQQSIKAYVDSQVGTVDTLAEILANGNTTGGTDIAVSANDDITFTDSSKALFGNGGDFQIFHNATNNVLNGVNGDTVFQLSGAEKARFSSTGLSVSGAVGITGSYNTSLGAYQVGSQTVITNGRNITNVVNVTTSGQTILGSGTTNAQSSDKLYIGGSGLSSADAAIYFGNNGGGSGVGWRFFYEGSGNGNLNKLIIRSENLGSPVDALAFTQDGNAVFAGTITSGAITSSGLVTADELSVTNDSTFNGDLDASGQSVNAANFGIGTVATVGSSSATTSATTQVAVDTVSKTAFRTVKYLVQITNSTDNEYHATEILVTHDGTTPSMTEYATIFTGTAEEATFSADISGSNLRLLATPASTDSMTFKITRTGIKV